VNSIITFVDMRAEYGVITYKGTYSGSFKVCTKKREFDAF